MTQRVRPAAGIIAILVIVVPGMYTLPYPVVERIAGRLDQLLGVTPLWGNFPPVVAGLA